MSLRMPAMSLKDRRREAMVLVLPVEHRRRRRNPCGRLEGDTDRVADRVVVVMALSRVVVGDVEPGGEGVDSCCA